jgi:vitamin B12 transporter
MKLVYSHAASLRAILFALLVAIFTLIDHSSVYAFKASYEESSDVMDFLLDKDVKDIMDVEVFSDTRNPKPLSQVAENMTVITSSEIEAMNAHSLADVLEFVTGVAVFRAGSVGSISQVSINGADPRYVAVYIDGVLLNNLNDNVADVGQIPAQIIDRIEIIKGPASSTWGSSLGGVINIITKSGIRHDELNATLLASYGERNTSDTRAELYGDTGGLGYYMNAGYFNTNGLVLHNMDHSDNEYGKVDYKIGDDSRLEITIGHINGSGGITSVAGYGDFNRDFSTFFTTATLEGKINESFGYSVSTRYSELLLNEGGSMVGNTNNNDRGYGSSFKITYKDYVQTVVFGSDLDWRTLDSQQLLNGRQREDKKAVFINDTVGIGKFTVTPGVRYDDTGVGDNFFSPSIGVTYKACDALLLRAYSARGFSSPPIGYIYNNNEFYIPNPLLKVEKIWTNQVGFETTAIPYVWLKGTVFANDISDAITELISNDGFTYVNSQQQTVRGFDTEIKTIPVYNVSLSSGFEFNDIKDSETNMVILDMPRYTYNLGVQYNDKKSLNVLLQGRYTWWNAEQGFMGEYNSMVFDISATKTVAKWDKKKVDIFAKANNIFNADSYLMNVYPNARRWVEGGVRFTF